MVQAHQYPSISSKGHDDALDPAQIAVNDGYSVAQAKTQVIRVGVLVPEGSVRQGIRSH